MNRSMHSDLAVLASIVPQVVAADNDGAAIDLRDYDAAEVVFNFGAIVSAGDFTPGVEESDASGSGFTDVAAADLLGTLSVIALTNTVERVGYRGAKRYIRATLTDNGGTSIAAGAVVVLGKATLTPTS